MSYYPRRAVWHRPSSYDRWDNEQDDMIRLYYPKDRAAGVRKHLPDRSLVAIRRRARAIGVVAEKLGRTPFPREPVDVVFPMFEAMDLGFRKAG